MQSQSNAIADVIIMSAKRCSNMNAREMNHLREVGRIVSKIKPRRPSTQHEGLQRLPPPWISAFLLCRGVRLEEDRTATIYGIGSAADVPVGELAHLTFLIVATGDRMGTHIAPSIEMETLSGIRRIAHFEGKTLAAPQQIVDWTITLQMDVPEEGLYRAKAFLNRKQRSELVFRVHVTEA